MPSPDAPSPEVAVSDVTDVSTDKALADQIGKLLKHKIIMNIGARWSLDKSEFAIHLVTDAGSVIIHASRIIALNDKKEEAGKPH